jgi:hypothetical protein
MNLRKGFARIARVTALAYWTICIVATSLSWWDDMHSYGSPPDYSRAQEWDWSRFAAENQDAAIALFWCAVAYFALLMAFRGLKWIALGFFDKAETP